MDAPSFQLSERYNFETPEQIDVSYSIAGIGSRSIAAIVDSIIIGVALLILMIPGTIGFSVLIAFVLRLFGRQNTWEGVTPFALAGTGFLSFCTIAFYYVLFEAFWHGQTPGKRWIGIRVIREGGFPVTFSTSMTRNIIRLIDFLPVYYMFGLIVMFIDQKSRRLGDLAAGTLVIKERKGITLERLERETRILPALHSSDAEPPATQIRNVRYLTTDDRHLLREYLARRSSINPEAADRIGLSLAHSFATKIGHELDGEPPSVFLERLARAIDEQTE